MMGGGGGGGVRDSSGVTRRCSASVYSTTVLVLFLYMPILCSEFSGMLPRHLRAVGARAGGEGGACERKGKGWSVAMLFEK
jgi:hypothetical protein